MLKFYPKILYKVDDFDYLKVTDISFYSKIKDFVSSFGLTNGRLYTIKNGETPSILSYKMYGTTRYEYSIMILNDIRNLYDEWPKDEASFKEYIEQKYGSISNARNTQSVYYRSDSKKLSKESWLNLADPDKYYETQYDKELRMNGEKARIKLLDFNLMVSFEVELRQLTAKLVAEELNRMQK